MALKSFAFAGDRRLEACLVDHAAHVVEGAVGHHVRKIQAVIEAVDGAVIADAEWDAMRYGPSTAAAVLAYKQARDIVNRSYQTKADNIVGKMTIDALDREIRDLELDVAVIGARSCKRAYHRDHKGHVPGPWQRRVLRRVKPDLAFAALNSASAIQPVAAPAPVRAPSARKDPEFFKPPNVFDGGFDPKQPFQMVPVSGSRLLGVKTGEQACFLKVETDGPAGLPALTMSVKKADPPLPAGLAQDVSGLRIPANTEVHFAVNGKFQGSGILVLRNDFGVAQKAMSFSVKSPLVVNISARILSDIRKRKAKRTVSDAVEAIVAASDFYEAWANVTFNLVGNPHQTLALKDLGDVIDLNDNKNWNAIVLAPLAGSDPTIVPKEETINVFFTWNIETRHSDPGMRTFGTTSHNYCVVEDANVEPRLDNQLVVKHEIGHALKLNHHSSAPSLMAENSFDMKPGLLMHEINTVNSSGTGPSI
jgi:hypothetical protein